LARLLSGESDANTCRIRRDVLTDIHKLKATPESLQQFDESDGAPKTNMRIREAIYLAR